MKKAIVIIFLVLIGPLAMSQDAGNTSTINQNAKNSLQINTNQKTSRITTNPEFSELEENEKSSSAVSETEQPGSMKINRRISRADERTEPVENKQVSEDASTEGSNTSGLRINNNKTSSKREK